MDLVEAQYSPYPAVVCVYIERYGVDFGLVNLEAFGPDYFEDSHWLYPYHPMEPVEPEIAKEGRDGGNVGFTQCRDLL